MNAQLSLALAAFALLAQLAITFLRWLRSPLRSVPGPLLARFTDLWYFHRLKQGTFERVNLELHEQYGPIVRYGPNRYSINDAESSKTIYGHGTQFQKSDWYSAWQPNDDMWNSFADRDIKHHAYNRRFYSNVYSMTSLVHYEPYVDECGALFSQRLMEFSKAGTAIDFGHWFQCFAFDAIAMMTYGKRLGFLDRGEDIKNVIDTINNGLIYSSLAGIFPWFHKYVMPLLRKLDNRSRDSTGMYVMTFTQKTIDDERASPKSVMEVKGQEDGADAGETFLSKYLAKHSSNPNEFTNYHILTGCAVNIFAGSDTTGISLSAVLYNLLKNPDSMAKLRKEIDDFTSRGELSEAPTFKESQQMPYLQAVIKEALRVHPAVGLPLERVVPEGGATISGRFFPEGSVVGINSWVQHKNETLFGDDADYFRPDRWIVRDFDFSLEGSAAAPGESWKTRNIWFVKPQNFHVKVQSRKTG
ncbi:cytochrome P450 oxidoreductase [Colletotrichum tofieldiae]|uniref:Cytochrome P450 oxidoreductase n=1 Tax=Colletotrichum tofieldiae TaxID=708197 RepID=A0A166YGT4_9PEZI|nr:cytochrome P450 oxidoreductase [Colletotrichum tofieldiae]